MDSSKKSFSFLYIFLVILILSVLTLRVHPNQEKDIVQERLYEEFNKTIQDLNSSKIKTYNYSILGKVKEEYIDRIQKDLSKVPEDYHKKILALCWTESNLRYDVIHSGSNDGTTTGICGIKGKYWSKLLKENNAELNSLYGGYIVLKYLEEKGDNSFHKGLRLYKGAVKDSIQVDKVYSVLKTIK